MSGYRYVVKDSDGALTYPKICRTCLIIKSADCYVSIFSKVILDGVPLIIADILPTCGNIKIENDEFPQYICESCVQNIMTCYNFRIQIECSENILRNIHSSQVLPEIKDSPSSKEDPNEVSITLTDNECYIPNVPQDIEEDFLVQPSDKIGDKIEDDMSAKYSTLIQELEISNTPAETPNAEENNGSPWIDDFRPPQENYDLFNGEIELSSFDQNVSPIKRDDSSDFFNKFNNQAHRIRNTPTKNSTPENIPKNNPLEMASNDDVQEMEKFYCTKCKRSFDDKRALSDHFMALHFNHFNRDKDVNCNNRINGVETQNFGLFEEPKVDGNEDNPSVIVERIPEIELLINDEKSQKVEAPNDVDIDENIEIRITSDDNPLDDNEMDYATDDGFDQKPFNPIEICVEENHDDFMKMQEYIVQNNQNLKENGFKNKVRDKFTICQVCGISVKKGNNIGRHSLFHNMKPKLLRKLKRRFICEDCGLLFVCVRDYKSHQRVHNTKKYLCEECGESFLFYSSFLLHSIAHTSDIKEFSDIKKFSDIKELRDIKEFKCSNCLQIFESRRLLKKHLVIHKERNPYSCLQCDESFRRAVNLTFHVETVHSKDK